MAPWRVIDAAQASELLFATTAANKYRCLVSKGADPTLVARSGQTTADMANGPVQRIQPFPETVALLEGLGSKNNHRCMSC